MRGTVRVGMGVRVRVTMSVAVAMAVSIGVVLGERRTYSTVQLPAHV